MLSSNGTYSVQCHIVPLNFVNNHCVAFTQGVTLVGRVKGILSPYTKTLCSFSKRSCSKQPHVHLVGVAH